MENNTEEIRRFGCGGLQDMLDLMPTCIEYEDNSYFLNITKGNKGFIVEYSFIQDETFVDLEGVKFYKLRSLFNTCRRDYDLFKALSSLLMLIFNEKERLTIIPRNHIFNK